jgi:predicted ferric reductase
MARLRAVFVAIPVILTAVWLVSAPQGSFTGGFWPARNALVHYTGYLAIGLMSLAVILAARPVQFEGALGGLDKFYRLHRWLGFAAALVAIAHWLAENAPRWMVQQGWLMRPQRPPRPETTGFDLFRDLRGVAGEAGEWAFYLLLVLVVLALWRRFPYRTFLATHRLMAPVYLVLVFHSLIMMGPTYWTGLTGPVMGLLMAGASVAAMASLFRRIGQSRRAVGRIESLSHDAGNSVLDVAIRLETAWPGHRAGQFAFVDFGGVERAHPFTMSTAWHRDGRLTFSIKGLGDYTRALPEQLFVGQTVTVEGPYGRFDFRGERPHQIWVGGGIGITPFIARLHALAEEHRGGSVDLIYSTDVPSESFIENIRHLAVKAGVRFHLVLPKREGVLTLDRLEGIIPDWKNAEIWFCGPLRFGDALRDAMVARGFSPAHFHQEMFDMR